MFPEKRFGNLSPVYYAALSISLSIALGNGLRLREEQQIISAAGFGVGAGHIESAEWVNADKRACALSIDVQVAHEEIVAGLFEIAAIV